MTVARHQHTEACVWKTYPSGKQACVTAKNERERALRAEGRFKSSGDPDRYRRQAPDGWEEEFGPVPLKERIRDWYDEVVVIRALTKQTVGRTPTPLEWAEIWRRFPRAQVTEQDIALAAGVSVDYVSERKRLA